MKNTRPIIVLVILVASIAVSLPVFAQSTQSSFTVNLTYLTVQLSFPAQVSPGDTVTVNIQASGKSYSTSGVSLTAQIYYANGTDLHQLTTATLSKNAHSGDSLLKQVQFTIPQDAPRTSLIAVLTEKVQTLYVTYYYYPTGHNYSSPYCYYYPSYADNCYYDHNYDGYGSGSAYPSYSYDTTTDSGVAPLSYILAKTPEYTSLQTQYQSLQSQYQALQQQLAQSQAQNQQLNQNLQNSQNTIAQRDATIASMNQQMSTTQVTTTTLEIVAAGLAILTLVFGVLAIRNRKEQPQPKRTA
jgi:hypothetical protein